MALVVCDDEASGFWSDAVDALGHDAEGIDVKAGIGFVQKSERGLEQEHLEDFQSLLLSSAKTVVHVTGENRLFHFERLHSTVQFLAEFTAFERFVSNRLNGFLQEGAIVESGGPELALKLEEQGYEWLESTAEA